MDLRKTSGRSPVIKREQTRLVSEEGEPEGTPAAVEVRPAAPNLTEIHVTCACGRRTVLACEHPARAARGAA
ncbi:MAG: hypothetical protein D6731_06120 [Planctomycetota bacterium]|nr:MAG: hypothetical protein D6731_06120 [Planctomycetota bacterium]